MTPPPVPAPAASTVALLERRGRFLTGRPLFGRGRPLTVDEPRGAGPGDLVLLAADGRRNRVRVMRKLGRPDVARDVIEGLMLDRGLRRGFDPAVEREAAAAHEHVDQSDARRDLRDLPTFTIDPVTARDFDDAISAERVDDERVRIWVHIADVAAHVAPGSMVDREALRRGTSVYVPGAVEPMLPHALSSHACSLVPGDERLAVTVEIDFRGAAVERSAFYRSRIRSDARLDYDRVDRIFAGKEQAEDPWATPLADARSVAGALAAARERRGALVVDSAEPEFEFDDKGNVVGAEPSVQTESHRLIEHLMIAANEQVATMLSERGVPTLYRVHEQPAPARVEHLVGQLASLDVPTPPLPENMSPQQAAELVGEISRLVDQHVRRNGHGRAGLSSLVLRSLQQAYYSPRNLGHAGLQSPRYSHFTSPIRRYPDLVAHRSLLSAIGAGEHEPRSGDLPDVGAWSSEREREAIAIERSAEDVARCFLLERALFESGWETDWEGEVVGLIGKGAFVAFGDGYEGLLAVRRLGDWWELNEWETALEAVRTGRRIRLGDPVTVRVERVDTIAGRVDLLPAEL